MKKLFTILTVVAISTTMTFAQQGSVAIGVGSNLANVSWQDYSLTPTVGYFITDNMMIGTGFSMGSSSSEDVYLDGWGDVGNLDEGSFNISPFVRYYVMESFYASVGIAIGSTSYEEDASDVFGVNAVGEYNTSTFGLNAGVGYSLMWNDRVCIEPSFGIATSSGSATSKANFNGSVTEVDTDAPSQFGMAIGLGIHIRLGGE
jgi:hypothetical protein